ncbi:unnamed protein product [Larinioides sclopetarius]|uniref:Uncharacterized protein n=1 Tax=Larinioides sclopetarius TaxID=280406 RepID=A0AAV1YZN5_9ARAC
MLLYVDVFFSVLYKPQHGAILFLCGFTSPALCWSLCPSSSCSTVWMRSPKAKVILPFIK